MKTKFNWTIKRDRESGYWIGVCDEQKMVAEGETRLDLEYMIEDMEDDYIHYIKEYGDTDSNQQED